MTDRSLASSSVTMPEIVGVALKATLGERPATRRHTDPPMATQGDSLAMRCLRDACETSGLPQKALAGKRDPKQFNKLLNGVQAYPVADLDDLPDDVLDDWIIRYGSKRGLICRRQSSEEQIAQLAEELIAATQAISRMTETFMRAYRHVAETK